MRKIFIDSRIDAIAEEYKKTVLKHLHYGTTKHLVNPKKKLQKFKKDFSEGQVKEIIGVDANGKKKICDNTQCPFKQVSSLYTDCY